MGSPIFVGLFCGNYPEMASGNLLQTLYTEIQLYYYSAPQTGLQHFFCAFLPYFWAFFDVFPAARKAQEALSLKTQCSLIPFAEQAVFLA